MKLRRFFVALTLFWALGMVSPMAFLSPILAQSSTQKSRADALLTRAGQLFLQKKYAQSQKLAEQALQLTPQYARAHLAMGMTLAQMGQEHRQKARMHLNSVTKWRGDARQRNLAQKTLRELGPEVTIGRSITLLRGAAILANSPSFLHEGQLRFSANDVMKKEGWQGRFAANSRTWTWRKNNAAISHRVGSLSLTRTVGSNRQTFSLRVSSHSHTGAHPVLVPLEWLEKALPNTRFEPRRFALILPNGASAPPETPPAEPETRPQGEENGTLVSLSGSRVTIRTANGVRSLFWSPDAQILRALTSDLERARVAVRVSPERPQEAREIERDQLLPGEAVRFRFDGDQVIAICAVSTVQGDTLLSTAATEFRVASAPEKLFSLGRMRFRDAQGNFKNSVSLAPFTRVALWFNPLSGEPFLLSVFPEDVQALEFPKISPHSSSEWAQARSFLSVSSDRHFSATGGESGVLLWQNEPARLLRRLSGSGGAIQAAWSPRGDALVVAKFDGSMAVWRFERGESPGGPPQEFWKSDELGNLTQIAWSPDGEMLACAYSSSAISRAAILFRDAQNGAILPMSVPLISSCKALLWLPAKRAGVARLLVSDAAFPISDYEVDRRISKIFSYASFTDVALRNVNALAFSAQKNLIVAGDESGIIHVWDVAGNDFERRTSRKIRVVGENSPILSLVVSADGERILAGQKSGAMHIADWNSERFTFKANADAPVLQLLWPDETIFAATPTEIVVQK